MRNRKKTYALVAILLAIAALGIGYAAISSILTIQGTAHILQSDGASVTFKENSAQVSGGQTGTAATASGTSGTCVVYLKTAGETATCTYTIKNTSTDTSLTATNLAATLYDSNNNVWSSSSDGYDYITVTTTLGATTLASAAETTVQVQVQLRKENTTGSEIQKTFTVKIDGNTSQS